jgi:4-hydroxy-tetrahydrodipicolinate reductase
MKIALIGYGKMGQAIEKLASVKGHEVVARIDAQNLDAWDRLDGKSCDVAIEFTRPDKAYRNITHCLESGLSVISGTTGWLDKLPEVQVLTEKTGGTFLHASNFSIGVNIFFMLNDYLAGKMRSHPQYEVKMEEIHHTEKLDAPSGTAVRLAEDILAHQPKKEGWINKASDDPTQLGIVSKRKANVPGTHTVEYASEWESIEIKHTAHNRDIFAAGALDVAEWIAGKTGYFTMKDYLNEVL